MCARARSRDHKKATSNFTFVARLSFLLRIFSSSFLLLFSHNFNTLVHLLCRVFFSINSIISILIWSDTVCCYIFFLSNVFYFWSGVFSAILLISALTRLKECIWSWCIAKSVSELRRGVVIVLHIDGPMDGDLNTVW